MKTIDRTQLALALTTLHGEAEAKALLSGAESSFDPERVLAGFERLGRAAVGYAVPWLVPVIEGSDFAVRVLASRPGLVPWLAGSRQLHREKTRERYRREAWAAVRGASDQEALLKRLRRYKYRELLRLVVRDTTVRAGPRELGREQSGLAEGLIEAALSWLWRAFVARYGFPEGAGGVAEQVNGFAVLGLGKLGGEDLNFSSDVDLLYLYRENGTCAGGLPHVQFFTKLGEALTRALQDVTSEGFCYRVDLNLRPHGRSGALVHSLSQASVYYQSFGRTWERAAMLKARRVAGDLAVSESFLSDLSPFVWRRSLDLSAVDELRELKAQIDLRGKASRDDVKLGPGGIREVEFFVNALQLVHGGKRPALRERHTLRALRKLEQAGLLGAPDADALEEAYLFLRRTENRLQMVEEKQTHKLPPSESDERARLARSLGFPSAAQFEGELERHRAFVREAFSTLLGQTARDDLPEEPLLALALDADAGEEERLDALARRGFATPAQSLAALDRLVRGPSGLFAQDRSVLQGIRLCADVIRTPDPDQALQHLSEFLTSLTAPQGYVDLLLQSSQARRRLLNLFGQSDFLSRYFLRHPELVDFLVQPIVDEGRKEPARIREELSIRVNRHADPEERLASMRRFKNEEVLRIGLADIAGEIGVPEVALQLTAIAEGILDEALFLATAEVRERYGDAVSPGRHHTLSVVGMGKLGGQELGYQSDLDLIFVYSGGGNQETSGGSRGRLSNHEYFAKIAQRLLTFMQMQLREGLLYKVDTRLRPSGNKGPLVASEEAFRAHHEKHSQLWERQALIKARGVAGDSRLFDRIKATIIDPLVYERPLPLEAGAEIDRLRRRMEREVARETSEEVNTKVGHGGLVDVEFATQYLQLVHGGKLAEVRSSNTLLALKQLASHGCLSPDSAEVLRSGYLFHRRVENRLRLVHGDSISALPTSGRPLSLLARRLGYLGTDPGPTFLADYRRQTAQVRAAYEDLMRTPTNP